MSKMFKLTLLALLSAFLVGCGSDSHHSSGPGPEEPAPEEPAPELSLGSAVPRTVQGYFPDFNQANAEYTLEILAYYYLPETSLKVFLQNWVDDGFDSMVYGSNCYYKDIVYKRAAGCFGGYETNKYAISEYVTTSNPLEGKIMDIPDSSFATANFQTHTIPFISIRLYKNFNIAYNTPEYKIFDEYGNSLTGSKYGFKSIGYVSSQECWQKEKNGFIYQWCYGINYSNVYTSWTIVKNGYVDAHKAAQP